MSLATECLKKQKSVYFSYIWRGIALMGLGICGGCMILKNGIGKAPEDENSMGGLLYKFMTSVMEKGETAEKLVPICFAGFFFLLAAIGLFNLIRGGWQIIPEHTILGKSIMHQKKSYESFQDVMDSINTDMAQNPHIFDTVAIGREWVLGIEAMRLARIQGVFWIDAGKDDYVLCCVDDAKNIWASSLEIKKDRDNAMKYLKDRLPDAVTGDKEVYIAFVNKESASDIMAQADGERTDCTLS